MFRASYQNITLLSTAFHVREAAFKTNSSFCIVSYDLLQNKEFFSILKEELIRYFNVKENIVFINNYKTDKEIQALVKENKQIIYLPEFALVKHRGKIIYRFLEDPEIYLLINNSLDKTKL